MAELSSVIDRKPVVQIIAIQADTQDLNPVLWGLEEEEIPAEVRELPVGDVEALAYQAAHMSALNVGIAINGKDRKIALSHRDLPQDHPLFLLAGDEFKKILLQRLGKNAARLVKGNPLIFKEEEYSAELPSHSATASKSIDLPDDMIQQIVRVVVELLANKG